MVTDVAIIGAGLSGLIAARGLQNAGQTVTVLDKGRSVGGRLATRRIGDGLADHGAQFFTVRDDRFQAQVDQWLTDDLIYVWGYGWSDGSGDQEQSHKDGHPRYVTRGGMNALAKDLAKSIDGIQVSTKVVNISYEDGLCKIYDENGLVVESKAVVLTAPVPQSLALIADISLSDADKQALERIDYGPCLCGLFVVDGDITLPEPGAKQDFTKTVYWIADNTAKGISPDEHIITVHADADYSRANYDDTDPAEIMDFLRDSLKVHLADGTTITSEQLKKWRYSIPLTMHDEDCLQVQGLPFVFAGDAFGGRARVEGAFLSGLAASDAVSDLFKSG